MQSYLAGIFKKWDSPLLIINGTADHTHALVNLSRKHSVMEVIKEVKRRSSAWIGSRGGMLSKFQWQSGYGVFSVCSSHAESVKEYIAGQEEHHRKMTFQEELRELLRQHEIEFDENYLWD
jgi:REP element-mobilizing transposase RayT